jgi:hypothetical protein
VVGINGLTVSTDLGPAQVSWYPSIGLLLSVARHGTEPGRRYHRGRAYRHARRRRAGGWLRQPRIQLVG